MEVTDVLSKNLIFVKDVQGKKLVPTLSALDLFDGATTELLMQCREPEDEKGVKMYGGDVNLRAVTTDGTQVFRMNRQSTAFKIKNLEYFDHDDVLIGELKQKAVSMTKTYRVTDGNGTVAYVLGVKGALGGYKITVDKVLAARVSLKWKGDNWELFKQNKCCAAIEMTPEAPAEPRARELILAASLCAEMLK